jgi:hypothetical protein
MHATVRRNQGVATKWPRLSREAGQALVRDLLEFGGSKSHDNWMRRPGSWSPGWRTTNPPKITNGKVIAHENVVPSPERPARKPRRPNALPRELHRRGSIQSTRCGLAARAGKR